MKLTNEVKLYAEKLLKAGYDILIYRCYDGKDMASFTFHKDGKLGYVQKTSKYGTFSFSPVHKPGKINGTGFRTFGSVEDPETYHAEVTRLMYIPDWGIGEIVKYKSLDEFLNSPLNKHDVFLSCNYDEYVRTTR